jgi:putative selenate reductase molybdopterin-binding subunit
MEKIARALNLDPIEFRLKNAIRPGEYHPFSTAWNEGREPRPEIIHTVGLEQCVVQGKAAIDWDSKFGNEEWHNGPSTALRSAQGESHLRKGIGVAMVMQGTAIPYLDMGGASIKMNDDGSFNLLVGATDLGTGSDTVLAQMAAEVLGVPVEDMITYSSDTDFTPFDKGAYASSTTYISGTAATNAAKIVAERIKVRAAAMLNAKQVDKETGIQVYKAEEIRLADRRAIAPDGESLTLAEVALNALHKENQEQIMGVASYVSPVSPPPFAAQFAEVTVDTETGAVTVDKLVMAVDSGVIVNPLTASGQIEGGMTQALGYAVCEEMRYDAQGNAIERDLDRYHIFRANEMPELETIFVETFEPSHPFGVKAVAEIPMDGVAPAVGNAIFDAVGADVEDIPVTPEKVWKALKAK